MKPQTKLIIHSQPRQIVVPKLKQAKKIVYKRKHSLSQYSLDAIETPEPKQFSDDPKLSFTTLKK